MQATVLNPAIRTFNGWKHAYNKGLNHPFAQALFLPPTVTGADNTHE